MNNLIWVPIIGILIFIKELHRNLGYFSILILWILWQSVSIYLIIKIMKNVV